MDLYKPYMDMRFLGLYCNFDRNQCEFVQRRDDKFDWTRKRGATSSGGTGPNSDVSGKGISPRIICLM